MSKKLKPKKPNIKLLKLEEVKPYWRNARINDDTIEVVKESIKEYGYNQKIAIDEDYVILAGHSRYMALRHLGYEENYFEIIKGLSDKAKKEYRIIDNKTHEFTMWNTDELILEMREIGQTAKMQRFFQSVDLTEMMNKTFGGNIKPITLEQIDDVSNNLHNAMDEHSNNINERKKQITCPHCFESYFIDENDLK